MAETSPPAPAGVRGAFGGKDSGVLNSDGHATSPSQTVGCETSSSLPPERVGRASGRSVAGSSLRLGERVGGGEDGEEEAPRLRWGRREAARASARPAPSPTPPRQRPARRLRHRAGFRREGAKSVTRNVTHGLRVSRVGAEIPARQGSRRAAPVVTGKEVHESRPLPNQRCHQGVPGCDRAVPRDRGARPPLC